MITDVTSGTTGGAAAQAAMKESTGMNKDDFLKLFVAQLQNQDPLNPQDGTQFIAQLAQLTQVEQAYNTNTNLQSMLNQGSNSATLAAVTLIGKQVEAPVSLIDLKSGTLASIEFKLDAAADQVAVSVLDADGTVVKNLSAGAMGAGAGSITWDGTDNTGAQLPAGAYSFSLSAKDASGNAIAGTGLVRGTVDAVDMSGGAPILSIGGVRLSLTEVTSVAGGA